MTSATARRLAKARRAAEQARLDAMYAENAKIVEENKCPYCGHALRRNLSLTGWYQCEQYGAIGFRAHDDKPACSFQTFVK